MLAQGIHIDVPEKIYHADPAPEPSLNQSLAKVLVEQSPRHAFVLHPRLNPNFEKDEGSYNKARAIGNAAHALMLGRGKQIAIADFKDFRSKDAQLFRETAEAKGQEVILAAHMGDAKAMIREAREQLEDCGWGDAFDPKKGNSEVVAIWQDGGVWCRTMIDWLRDDHLVVYDFKTGGGVFAPHVVGDKIVDDGWDVQGAMIERALDCLLPKHAGRRTYRFVAQENYEPYALVAVELTEAHLTMGRKKLAVAMDLWRLCTTTNKWPRYPSRVVRPEYPAYKESKWLEREADYHDSGITGEQFWQPGELLQPAEIE